LDSTLKNVTIPTLEIIELKNNSKRLDENKFSENVKQVDLGLYQQRQQEFTLRQRASGTLETFRIQPQRL
jgi:hypothetical protein